MQLCLLHLDNALSSQEAFMESCRSKLALEIDALQMGARIRLWSKRPLLRKLSEQLAHSFSLNISQPKLCFMGSGDFHHVSALLLENALETQDEPITVIHFDNHPDWVHFNDGMHCGSWINQALQHPKIHKLITVGVCSHDLRSPERKGANLAHLTQGKHEVFPYHHAPSKVKKPYGSGSCYQQIGSHLHWKTIEHIGEQAFVSNLLARITTQRVYITIDKDVLAPHDAHTNWDQGMMRLPFLLHLVQHIGQSHCIIGADVNGDYSMPHYQGNPWNRFMKHVEILIDQPRNTQDLESSSALNSASNHALLNLLSEVMA